MVSLSGPGQGTRAGAGARGPGPKQETGAGAGGRGQVRGLGHGRGWSCVHAGADPPIAVGLQNLKSPGGVSSGSRGSGPVSRGHWGHSLLS